MININKGATLIEKIINIQLKINVERMSDTFGVYIFKLIFVIYILHFKLYTNVI